MEALKPVKMLGVGGICRILGDRVYPSPTGAATKCGLRNRNGRSSFRNRERIRENNAITRDF
jgi:hypothetical protein